MFRLVTLFALVSCNFVGTLTNDLVGRAVNAALNTTIEKHPYQVSMQNKFGIKDCGGAIINPDTIVTAGHCVYKRIPLDYKIRLGSTDYNSGGELVEVRDFRIHEEYNATTDLNDIGIIKLAKSVRETNTVRYVQLATQAPKAGTPAVVTGWGTQCFGGCNEKPAILQEVELKIVKKKECAKINDPTMQPSMLCAYASYKDTCIGDPGGPLVAESKLVGVVSWTYGCASGRHPAMYTDIAYFHKWILDTAKSL